PLAIAVREGSDEGRPIVAVDPDHEAARAFADIAAWIDEHAPSRRTHPELKIL
ncbi:MAG: sodium:proton antiporter, partial [Actinomyces sp.]